MIHYKVPFYANLDNTHCYQAALRSVLKYFLPDKEYSWKELEEMTAKRKGFWTWPTQGLINLYKMGFKVVNIEDFDAEEFVQTGEDYLLKTYGHEIGKLQIANSDIPQEQKLYKEYLTYHNYQRKLPQIEDIKALLDDGYLVICNINARALNNKDGYVGHFIVIVGCDEKDLFLHDPGLPPFENRKVTFDHFTKAWAYPDDRAKNLIGVRYSLKQHY